MERIMLLLALPASAGLIVLADPISHVLFEHGAFDHAAQQATRDAPERAPRHPHPPHSVQGLGFGFRGSGLGIKRGST